MAIDIVVAKENEKATQESASCSSQTKENPYDRIVRKQAEGKDMVGFLAYFLKKGWNLSKTLAELEARGFDVGAIHARLQQTDLPIRRPKARDSHQ